MLIPDSVRQEDMPMMVYFLCKLVSSGKYTEDEAINLLTASTISGFSKYKSESNPIADVVRFTRDEGKFIKEGQDGILYSDFSEEEISTFALFMDAILKKMQIDEKNKFIRMLKWLLVEKRDLSRFTKTSDYPAAMNIDGVNDENTVHGFLFWAEAMGVITFEGKKGGTVVYSLESILERYVERHPELSKRGAIPAREFLDELTEEVFFIPMCIHNNTLSFALSQGIRILEQAGMIELLTANDSGDSWHLYPSEVFLKGNNFSNIRVC